MTEICPIWTAIIQNVGYSPHPWDNAREGSLTGVSDAVNVIRDVIATRASAAREEALGEVVAWLREWAEEQTDRASEMIAMDARLVRILTGEKRSIARAIERRDHLRGRGGQQS